MSRTFDLNIGDWVEIKISYLLEKNISNKRFFEIEHMSTFMGKWYYDINYKGRFFEITQNDIVRKVGKGDDNMMFTKEDLQTGDIIVTYDKDIGVILKEQNIIMYRFGWDDLTRMTLGEDICKVYRGNLNCHFCFENYNQGDLIFDSSRDLTLKEETVMTISEIEEKLGIKNLKITKEKD